MDVPYITFPDFSNRGRSPALSMSDSPASFNSVSEESDFNPHFEALSSGRRVQSLLF
jgi:hypothetical protein